MRFLLLLLSLVLQWIISGYGIDIPNDNRMPGIDGKLLAIKSDGNVPLHEWKTTSERAWDTANYAIKSNKTVRIFGKVL
jgi:hypothetical protein